MKQRVLLSTIGSRGDVQPLVALATELVALGRDVRLCVPPDFCPSIEGLGFAVTAIGPTLRTIARWPGGVPTPDQVRQMIEGTVATQFDTIARAAEGCDTIVGATALQVAAPSIAEQMGVPYVFAAYCPVVLPSPHHAPPLIPHAPAVTGDHRAQWHADAERWNAMWGPALNAQRATRGLAPIADVRSYVHTAEPWLGADPVLAPWHDDTVFQPGAWILEDTRPLGGELERFLDGGEPPIYVGFGSTHVPEGFARAAIDAARALGRRVILSAGWAELPLADDAADCMAIGEVNQQALFARVAAVIHHGGAGTTTAAARAGAPQIVIPQHYDQPYWAGRVVALGIGAQATLDSLAPTLEHVLRAPVRRVAVRGDGARAAALRLV